MTLDRPSVLRGRFFEQHAFTTLDNQRVFMSVLRGCFFGHRLAWPACPRQNSWGKQSTRGPANGVWILPWEPWYVTVRNKALLFFPRYGAARQFAHPKLGTVHP